MKFIDSFVDVTKKARKLPTSEYKITGKHPIIDQGQKQIAGYTDIEEGLFTDVPAIIFGDHTRVIKYIDTPFFIGADGVKVIKCLDKQANYNYLYYLLSSVRIPNTGYNRHYKWLKEAHLVEHTKEEQEKIVVVLSTIDNILDLYSAQLNKLDELIKSRFVEMFGDWSINPNMYNIEALDKHIDVLSGFPFDSSLYVNDGINICGGLIIMPHHINWDECKHWKTTSGYKDYILCENDIVMALDRPWISEGFKIAKIDKTHLPALLIQRTARIRAIDINQEYLYHCFDNCGFDNHCNITGSLVPHISLKDIKSFKVMISPINLQNQFADFVTQVEKQKATVQQSIDKLETLKKSLMQECFG